MTYDNSAAEAKKDAALAEAGDLKDTALSAGGDLKDTAAVEAADLKDHALDKASSLLDEGSAQVQSRLAEGQQLLAKSVREFSDELGEMAQAGNGGYAAQLAHEISGSGAQAARFLERREPADVLDEVRSFASRRPMAFLGIALGAGVVVGRLARGLQSAQQPSAGRRVEGQRALTTGEARPVADMPGSQPTYPSEHSTFNNDPGVHEAESAAPTTPGFQPTAPTAPPAAYGTSPYGGAESGYTDPSRSPYGQQQAQSPYGQQPGQPSPYSNEPNLGGTL